MTQSHQMVSDNASAPFTFADRVAGKMPWLLAIWLFLAVLGPHQELYKVFFHGVVMPALLILVFSGRLSHFRPGPLLTTAVVFFAYAGITTFFVGLGPLENHLRALRWCVESAFLLLALWLWMPTVMGNRLWWARYLLWLALLGALAGIVRFVFLDDLAGRLSGLGGLHNPIHTAAVLLVLFAMGHMVLAETGYPRKWLDGTLALISFVLVCVAVLMSESRAPIGGMVVYSGFLVVLGLFAGPNWKQAFAYVLALLLVVVAVTLIYDLEQFFDHLMARGLSHRLEIWKGYFLYPPDSWWVGFGLGTEKWYVPAVEGYWEPNQLPVGHPHSVYIGTLIETGIIGSMFLFAMIAMLIRNVCTCPLKRTTTVRLLGLLGLVFLLTVTVSQGVISSAKAVWLYFWLPVSYVWFWGVTAHWCIKAGSGYE